LTYADIAILKLSSLGDIIHTLPAFNLLRTRYPDAKISWIVEPAGAKLLENFTGIDEIIIIHLKAPTLANKFKEVRRIIRRYKNRFDLIFDFQGLLKSAVLSYLLKSYVVGFNKRNLREPAARFLYGKRADIFDENNHVIYKNIHLANSVGDSAGQAAAPETTIAYPSLKKIPSEKSLVDFFSENKLAAKKYFILNVGGGWETKKLTDNQYIHIVKRLKEKLRGGDRIVILWGNEQEKETAAEISRQTGAVMSAFLSFSLLIRFIGQSRFIITADTLPLHIADMVGAPSVGIFGPTSPGRNGSLLKESSAVYENLSCNFCYKKKCGKMECIKNLNLEKVIKAIEKINEKCG
jgi:heptosyltransferase-1